MPLRLRAALVVITALVLMPGVAVGLAEPKDPAPARTSLVGADERGPALAAVPVRSPQRGVPRVLAQAAAFMALVTAIRFSLRRRALCGLPFRLADVGDRWRALLFGAPPSLL